MTGSADMLTALSTHYCHGDMATMTQQHEGMPGQTISNISQDKVLVVDLYGHGTVHHCSSRPLLVEMKGHRRGSVKEGGKGDPRARMGV
eukprot:scaffold16571_cov76-Attheya_sp.AAC.6